MDPKDLEYKNLIVKLAADWNKGLSLLQFKFERCKDQSGFGCDTTCFKSGSILGFMTAMNYVEGANGQKHAKVYADMIEAMTKAPVKTSYEELIKKLAADWCSGIEMLQLKLDVAKGDVWENDDGEDEDYGCLPNNFKSNNLDVMYCALEHWEARGYSCEKQHAVVYADMLVEMEEKQLVGKRATGVIMDDLAVPAEQPKLPFTAKPEDERVSWMFYTNQLSAQPFIIARKNGASFHWSKTGNNEQCLKLNGMDDDDFGAWWVDWFERYASGHTAHIAFGHWLEAECKRFDNMPKHERLKLQAKYADLATRCVEDEPGPEDARFGERDDMYDGPIWTPNALHKIDFGASPACTGRLYYNPPGNPTPTFEGTIPMSTTSLSFTTVNYVSINNGPPIDLSKLPADNIFSLIEQTEAEVKRLGEIANKPKALVKRIEDLNAGITRLVAEVDSRDE